MTLPWGFSTDQVAPDAVSIRDPLTTATAVIASLVASTATIGVISVSSGTVTLSSAIAVSSGIITLSSAPSISSGNITLVASTATIGAIVVGSSYNVTPVYITTADIQKVSSSPGTLWSITAYTTSTGSLFTATPGIVRLYNSATSATTSGDGVVFSIPMTVFGTATAVTGSAVVQSGPSHNFGPRGMAFSVACSVDTGTVSTGTTPLANAKISALYST